MMHAKRVYEAQRSLGWSRVDMLIALYDSGIATVQAAMEAVANNQADALEAHRQKALRVVHGLAAGLDTDQGEIPKQLLRLCEFMQHSLGEPSHANLQSVLKVLTTLREAFQAIRDDAAQMEREGRVPSIDLSTTLQVTV